MGLGLRGVVALAASGSIGSLLTTYMWVPVADSRSVVVTSIPLAHRSPGSEALDGTGSATLDSRSPTSCRHAGEGSRGDERHIGTSLTNASLPVAPLAPGDLQRDHSGALVWVLA
jgi:hypothetical protein